MEERDRAPRERVEAQQRHSARDAPTRRHRGDVIVVDDGLANWASQAGRRGSAPRRQPARLIVAVPVGPKETVDQLRTLCDEVVCLEVPPAFAGVGAFYADFSQVEDGAVVDMLQQAAASRE